MPSRPQTATIVLHAPDANGPEFSVEVTYDPPAARQDMSNVIVRVVEVFYEVLRANWVIDSTEEVTQTVSPTVTMDIKKDVIN